MPRLFVAVELTKETLNYLYELPKRINQGNSKIKWVAKKNIHLTLKFIGNVNDNMVNEIKDRLRKIRHDKFEIILDKIGWFPGDDRIRVIWAGLQDSKKIDELQKMIDGELLSLLPGEQKFSSHITIGRIKRNVNNKVLIDSLKELKIDKMKIEVNEFSLVESKLTKDGSRYTVLEKFKLD